MYILLFICRRDIFDLFFFSYYIFKYITIRKQLEFAVHWSLNIYICRVKNLLWSKCITGNGHYISISKWNIYRVIAQKYTSIITGEIFTPMQKKTTLWELEILHSMLRVWVITVGLSRWRIYFSLDYSYSVYVFINILSMFLTGFVSPFP